MWEQVTHTHTHTQLTVRFRCVWAEVSWSHDCSVRLYRNALCGKLQCSNVQVVTVFGIEPSIISTPIAGGKCYGVDFMLGSDVPDPGMVNEGTKCGDNKVRRRRTEGNWRRSCCWCSFLLLWFSGLHELWVSRRRRPELRLWRGEQMSRTRGETRPPVCLSVCLSGVSLHLTLTRLSVRLRCVTVTRTVTVTTAGLLLSVRSKVTVAAWTVDPHGTVPSPLNWLSVIDQLLSVRHVPQLSFCPATVVKHDFRLSAVFR